MGSANIGASYLPHSGDITLGDSYTGVVCSTEPQHRHTDSGETTELVSYCTLSQYLNYLIPCSLCDLNKTNIWQRYE